MSAYRANFRFTATILIATLLFLGLNSLNIIMVAGGINHLLDFGSFIASGQLASQGENPYGLDSPFIFAVEFPDLKHTGIAPNLNPPISVLIFQIIASIPPEQSIIVWRILTFLFYVYSLHLLSRHYKSKNPNRLRNIAWALTLAGFWHTIQLGQLYTFLLVLVVGIYLYTEKGNHIAAGILLGILTAIKPNFVFWILAVGIARQWITFATAGITALSISLVPIYFYGFKIYQQWLEATQLFTPDLLIFPGNNSLQGLTARFNIPQAGVVMSIILSLTVLLLIYKRRPALFSIHSISIITSLLISPIAWTGYTILTLPVFFKVQKWPPTLWIAASLFAIPFLIVLTFFERSFFNFIFWGWIYGWGLLFLLVDEVKALEQPPVAEALHVADA